MCSLNSRPKELLRNDEQFYEGRYLYYMSTEADVKLWQVLLFQFMFRGLILIHSRILNVDNYALKTYYIFFSEILAIRATKDSYVQVSTCISSAFLKIEWFIGV